VRRLFDRIQGGRKSAAAQTSHAADGSAILPTMDAAARGRLPLARLLRWGLWAAGGLVVFVLATMILLPTEILAWRIGYEARKRGYDIEVGDVSVRPWGTIVLEDVRWTFRPSRPGQVPDTLRIESAVLDVSVLRALVGTVDLTYEMDLGGGRVFAHWNDGGDAAQFELSMEDVPLGALPKAHQLLNAPLGGTVRVKVDLTMPDHKFGKTQGVLEFACEACSIGDGETLLFVPGAKGMLEKGVTIPEIDLGTLDGRFVFEKGVGKTDGPIVAKSEDVELTIDGTVRLADPFRKSRIDTIVKLRVAEGLQQRDERVRLLVQTMPKTQRLKPPESGFGFKLYGPVTRPRLRGIYAKTREERLRERRERARRRAEKRAAKKKRRRKKKKKAPEPSAKQNDAEDETAEKAKEKPNLEIQPIDPAVAPTVGKAVRLGGDGTDSEHGEAAADSEGSAPPGASGNPSDGAGGSGDEAAGGEASGGQAGSGGAQQADGETGEQGTEETTVIQ